MSKYLSEYPPHVTPKLDVLITKKSLHNIYVSDGTGSTEVQKPKQNRTMCKCEWTKRKMKPSSKCGCLSCPMLLRANFS